MINLVSNWTEQIVIAIIVSSIIEMLLPESKNKKYIKMMLGIYVLFTIISPIINKNDLFKLDNTFNIESYVARDSNVNDIVNQKSMDERLQELYVQELEKNIITKVKQEGYEVYSCDVDAVLYGNEENQDVKSIKLLVSMQESNLNIIQEEKKSNIKPINKVEINTGLDKILNRNNENGSDEESTIIDIKKLKESLSSYYGIDSNKINISIK